MSVWDERGRCAGNALAGAPDRGSPLRRTAASRVEGIELPVLRRNGGWCTGAQRAVGRPCRCHRDPRGQSPAAARRGAATFRGDAPGPGGVPRLIGGRISRWSEAGCRAVGRWVPAAGPRRTVRLGEATFPRKRDATTLMRRPPHPTRDYAARTSRSLAPPYTPLRPLTRPAGTSRSHTPARSSLGRPAGTPRSQVRFASLARPTRSTRSQVRFASLARPTRSTRSQVRVASLARPTGTPHSLTPLAHARVRPRPLNPPRAIALYTRSRIRSSVLPAPRSPRLLT
jgi:hypothetical protein